MTTTSYVIALGSNRPSRHGPPARALHAALTQLQPVATSPILHTAPLGPSNRRYANAVAIVESPLQPDAMLQQLKAMERAFGRRRGQVWGSRVIDLDIILWSGGAWSSPGLNVPHRLFRERDFVLKPLLALAPNWRDPISGFTVRQLAARLARKH